MARKKKNAQLDAGNALTIEHVSRLRKDYDAIIEKSNEVEVVSKKMDSIDLTGIQLLHYFQKHAEKNKKVVQFTMNLNNEQKKMLERNGFDQILELFK